MHTEIFVFRAERDCIPREMRFRSARNRNASSDYVCRSMEIVRGSSEITGSSTKKKLFNPIKKFIMKYNAIPCAVKTSGGVLKELKKEYPVILPAHVIKGKAVEDYLLRGEGLSPVALAATLAALPRMMTTFISMGHPVKIDGIGTFFITMKGDVETDADGKKVLKNDCVDKIVFRPCKSLLNELRLNTKFNLIQNGGDVENDAD